MSLQKFIQRLPLDKKDHVILGVILSVFVVLGGLVCLSFYGDFGMFIGSTIGFIFSIGFAGGKEVIHDWLQKKGNPETWDFIATAVPILLVYIGFLVEFLISI